MEEQWEAEMKRLEEERLQALQKEEELKKMVENDEVVQNLDKELQSLIQVSTSCTLRVLSVWFFREEFRIAMKCLGKQLLEFHKL